MMLYCDNCNWSQDDFWSLRGYNPLRTLWQYIKMGWKPVYSEWDPVTGPFSPESRGHNWTWLGMEIRRLFRRLTRQRWWTWWSWQRAIKNNGGKWPTCPDCGTNQLGID